jgi:hypothetical protein
MVLGNMREIAILTARETETLFYDLLAKNGRLPVKEMCRKIPRKMVYKYLNNLSNLQETMAMQIFQRQASICQITGLPNIIIERKCQINIMQINEKTALVTLK